MLQNSTERSTLVSSFLILILIKYLVRWTVSRASTAWASCFNSGLHSVALQARIWSLSQDKTHNENQTVQINRNVCFGTGCKRAEEFHQVRGTYCQAPSLLWGSIPGGGCACGSGGDGAAELQGGERWGARLPQAPNAALLVICCSSYRGR